MIDLVKDFWGLIAAMVAAIAWVIRLEAKAHSNTSRIQTLEDLRKEDLANSREHRDRVERQLENIQQDVKTILMSLRSDK